MALLSASFPPRPLRPFTADVGVFLCDAPGRICKPVCVRDSPSVRLGAVYMSDHQNYWKGHVCIGRFVIVVAFRALLCAVRSLTKTR